MNDNSLREKLEEPIYQQQEESDNPTESATEDIGPLTEQWQVDAPELSGLPSLVTLQRQL